VWFWLFYSPSLILTLILVYIVGFTVIILGAGYIAPRVARRVAGKFSLQASMAILGLIVVLAGIAGVGIVAYILLEALGAVEVTVGLIISMLVLVLLLNLVSYLLAPFAINMMYGARRDSQLQLIVNEVARTLGFSKPPRAVVVEGLPNAFAYGNFISGRYVAVSRSLIEISTPEELRAVIGHELGHHKHRDNAVMLFMGLIPSLLYFLGVMLVRLGIISSYTRTYSSRRRESGGGLVLVLAGLVAIAVSFIVQILVLAFSRLREYYADAAGAHATSPRAMQRALARLHVYYSRVPEARGIVRESKLRALFIYAFTETYANPFYRYRPAVDPRSVDIDRVVEELKRAEVEELFEFLSTHPPIPKRIRFLDTLYYSRSTSLR
jgi:heat shock protein HtpX